MISHPPVSQRHTLSKDGTSIGYISIGSGPKPGLVLIQGAMGTAHNYRDLAYTLSSSFTVHVPDRRGRGMSLKPYNASHDIARDVEDVDAVLSATGSSYVFGLSSGAIITLEATRILDRITKSVAYEPPFYPDGKFPYEGVNRLNEQIERGDLAAGMLSALVCSEIVPAFGWIPGFLGRTMTAGVLRFDDWSKGSTGGIANAQPELVAQDGREWVGPTRLRDMVPSVRYDFNVVQAMNGPGRMQGLKVINKPVLVVSGNKTVAYLAKSAEALGDIIPQGKHLELSGLDHGSAWNGGKTEVVANALIKFFGEQ